MPFKSEVLCNSSESSCFDNDIQLNYSKNINDVSDLQYNLDQGIDNSDLRGTSEHSTSSREDIDYETCLNIDYKDNYCSNVSFNNKISISNAEGITSVSSHKCPTKKQYNVHSNIELQFFTVKELKILVEDLAHVAKEVSEELVQLLQEKDMLLQESDARNIAIEQLLKLTVNQAETELRPIQMSVIYSSGDTWD